MRLDRRLTEAEKIDARQALRDLEGSGLSLVQAVAVALKQPGGAPVRISPWDALDAFLQASLRRGCRPRTIQFYREQLTYWLQGISPELRATLDGMKRPDLRAYLEGLDLSPASVRCRHRAIRALYRWARRQEPPLCRMDPTEGLEVELAAAARKIRIFDADDTAAMLAAAGKNVAAMALAFFAGLRPEELGGFDKDRLRWEDINFDERVIHVRAEVSKTGKARAIDGLPDTVWRWIEHERRKLRGPVLGCQWRSLVPMMKRKLARETKQKRSPWIQDGPRHTFATMALALTGDPGQVSTWLGHEGSTRLLFNHYRGVTTRDGTLVTRKIAEGFWGLRPEGNWTA